MDRKKFLFRKRISYMVLLSAVFMAINIIFIIVVYNVAQSSQFEETDKQVLEARDAVLEKTDNAISNFLKGKQIVYFDNGRNYVISYKIFILLRDHSGEIINSEYLNSFDYMLNLDFARKSQDTFNTYTVVRNGEEVSYRSYMFAVTGSDGETYYIQLAADVSEIVNSLKLLGNTLIFGGIIAIIAVLLAGWFLSKILVSGVIEGWERQDEFISYASHEIRSPLAVIHSSLELLLEKPGARIIDRSDLIINSLAESNRLRKMSNNLIEMAKLQSSDLVLHLSEINVKEMVEDFIEPFVFQAEDTERILKYYVDDNIMIRADRQLLTELLVIFLENALKYTGNGDIIQLWIKEGDNKVTFRVDDSGIGISEDGLKKVFSRFYRGEQEQSKVDGSGLGLYIASLIVQAHKGKITAEANVPKGTVFCAVIDKNL